MGTRIPFSIQRLPQATGTSPADSVRANDYLVDVTTNDIERRGDTPRITVKPSNIPGQTGGKDSQTVDVNYDSLTGLYYVVINQSGYNNVPLAMSPVFAHIFYIRDPKKNVLITIPDIFTFYVNPQNFTPTARKIVTETRTRGGWEIQHWGEQLAEIQVNGKSGGMHRGMQNAGNQSIPRGTSVTQSTAWLRLTQLKRLYDADHSIKNASDLTLLGLNYYDRYYKGYFTDFTGPTADASDPYQVNYSFTFKVQSESPSDVFDTTPSPSGG
jgi:hypothetical protein